MGELRVASVEVRDVLGARSFAMSPGKITVLRGRNGTGKSSALAALQAALGGGNLARLARVDGAGADVEPEVVLVLQGAGAEEHRVERKGEKVRVRSRVGQTAAFEDIASPATWLKGLYDTAASNPVRFLQASDKDRAVMLLEALPLTMDEGGLTKALAGVDASVLPAVPRGIHPLERLALIRSAVFLARTAVNRDQRGKAQAADQTRRAAPAEIPADPAPEIARVEATVASQATSLGAAESTAKAAERAALEAAERTRDAADDAIVGEHERYVAEERRTHAAFVERRRREVEEEIARHAAESKARVAERAAQGETRRSAAEAACSQAQEVAREHLRADLEALAPRRADMAQAQLSLATLRERANHYVDAVARHELAEQFERDAAALAEEGARLTGSLERLDALRSRLARDLPIDGLEIEGQGIKVHGVPYEQLNTAQRVEIAVRVACLRARGARLPVVFVDGAEALDREHFDLLVEALRAAGVQAFLGRVEDRDFAAETA